MTQLRVIKIDSDIVFELLMQIDNIAFTTCKDLDNVETLLHFLNACARYASGAMDNPKTLSSPHNLELCMNDIKNAFNQYVDLACKPLIEKAQQSREN